jgi:hypothetical protein
MCVFSWTCLCACFCMYVYICARSCVCVRVCTCVYGCVGCVCVFDCAWFIYIYMCVYMCTRSTVNTDSPVVPMMFYHSGKMPLFSRMALDLDLAVVVVSYPATQLLLSRVRFCMTSGHTIEQLEEAVAKIHTIGQIVRAYTVCAYIYVCVCAYMTVFLKVFLVVRRCVYTHVHHAVEIPWFVWAADRLQCVVACPLLLLQRSSPS